jgi:hypothetical protein
MMIVYCFCGNRYEADEIVICMNVKCSAYGIPVAARGEPTAQEILDALDFVAAVHSLQND